MSESERGFGISTANPGRVVKVGVRCAGGVESCSSVSASAALNVLLNNHAAVSEERTGHALLQRPHVRTGVKGLHGSQRWTLAAHDAARHVDLPVQDHRTGKDIISELV